jgi:hypothetical protein
MVMVRKQVGTVRKKEGNSVSRQLVKLERANNNNH